jgi:hypothetical protein
MQAMIPTPAWQKMLLFFGERGQDHWPPSAKNSGEALYKIIKF